MDFKLKNIKQLFFFFLLFTGFGVYSFAGDTTTIIILHTNDMHAHIEKFSPMASYVEMFREKYPNVFLFSAGDIFTGNPIVDKYPEPGFPIIDLMNRVGYNVSAIGNHEFDYGQETLLKRITQANFPFICANMEVTPQSILEQPKPMVTFYTKDSLKILVLGLLQTGKNGLPDALPSKLKGINFKNPIKVAKKYKTYRDSCNVFIALTHLGVKTDRILAAKDPFFDAIVGGHSHTVLPHGEMVKNTLIVQAGHYTDYLGVLTLKLVNGKVVSKQDSLMSLEMGIACHYEISQLIFKYNQSSDLNTVIGIAKQNINGLDNLGALITDAMRKKMNVDIAFQNKGGIRIEKIPQGNITIKQIYELSPFGNTFVRYNLTVKKIKRLIRYAYSLHQDNELQVSGLKINLVVINKKLKQIFLQNENGEPLTKKIYSVAINNYMASAYKLPFLKNGKATGIEDATTTINFIKQKKVIDYTGIRRVKIKGKK